MSSRAFSMVELVIVVVIIGIIGAIAAPRFNGMADRAKERRLFADLGTLQRSAEHFSAEHRGLSLGRTTAGGLVASPTLIARLTGTSDDAGRADPEGLWGPYLRAMPANALNGLATVRVDGTPAGVGTHGWRFDTALGAFQADTAVTITLPDGSTMDHKGVTRKAGVGVVGGGGGGGGMKVN